MCFSVLSWLHPELNLVEDEDERYWVAWVAEMSREPPKWKVYLFFILFCGIFPATGALLAFRTAPRLGMSTGTEYVLLGGVAAGVVIPFALWLLLRLRRVRHANISTLRNIGSDICPECEYDMSGHAFEATRSRTCPECGASILAECLSGDLA